MTEPTAPTEDALRRAVPAARDFLRCLHIDDRPLCDDEVVYALRTRGPALFDALDLVRQLREAGTARHPYAEPPRAEDERAAGNFVGHGDQCEHRTAGPHRAWCHDCTEWCYPHHGCARCRGLGDSSLAEADEPDPNEVMREEQARWENAVCQTCGDTGEVPSGVVDPRDGAPEYIDCEDCAPDEVDAEPERFREVDPDLIEHTTAREDTPDD